MTQLQKLEQQKQALLEKIRIRRAEYRIQLMPYDKVRNEQDGTVAEDTFPRSVAFKLLSRHPYFLLGVAAALIFAGPRKSLIAAATSTAVAALQRYGINHIFHSHK